MYRQGIQQGFLFEVVPGDFSDPSVQCVLSVRLMRESSVVTELSEFPSL